MPKYFEIKYSRKFSSKHNLTYGGLPKSVTVSCASLLPCFFLDGTDETNIYFFVFISYVGNAVSQLFYVFIIVTCTFPFQNRFRIVYQNSYLKHHNVLFTLVCV